MAQLGRSRAYKRARAERIRVLRELRKAADRLEGRKMNQKWLNLTALVGLTLMAIVTLWSSRARSETVQLNGFPMSLTICGGGEARSQDAGGKLHFFCESTGKVELTIEHCTGGVVRRSPQITTYSCNEEQAPTPRAK